MKTVREGQCINTIECLVGGELCKLYIKAHSLGSEVLYGFTLSRIHQVSTCLKLYTLNVLCIYLEVLYAGIPYRLCLLSRKAKSSNSIQTEYF